MIKKQTLCVTGLTGNGNKTGEVWNGFEMKYDSEPFSKVEESAYEIRFWESRYSGRTPDPEKSVHVGFISKDEADSELFRTVKLPAAEYAVFDVYVAKGYDSGNEEMEKWIADNADTFRMMELNGYEYIIECYNDKFKGGDHPDSVVEMWIPVHRICKCCSVSMTMPEDFSEDSGYCSNCNRNGELYTKATMDELTANVQALIDIESAHQNLLSTALLNYVSKWLTFTETEKAAALPVLLSELIDGQDCDYAGTQWEEGWLADGGVCHCTACISARKCISDIKRMETGV